MPGEYYTFKSTLETTSTDHSTEHSNRHEETPQTHTDNTQPPPLQSSSMYHIDPWTHKVLRDIATEYNNDDPIKDSNKNGRLYPYLLESSA
eukprot:15178199-Ditylum_brightwellii.AAC.1